MISSDLYEGNTGHSWKWQLFPPAIRNRTSEKSEAVKDDWWFLFNPVSLMFVTTSVCVCQCEFLPPAPPLGSLCRLAIFFFFQVSAFISSLIRSVSQHQGSVYSTRRPGRVRLAAGGLRSHSVTATHVASERAELQLLHVYKDLSLDNPGAVTHCPKGHEFPWEWEKIVLRDYCENKFWLNR